MRKSLYDISWQVTEPEYREDPALSYSTLARYEREGFNNISKLFDKVETPSLTFGSAVDSIITGGMEEFIERFEVCDFPSTPDSIIKIVKQIYYEQKTRSLDDLSNDTLMEYVNRNNYQANWRPDTRVKVLKEKGEPYYKLLSIAESKTIIDTETYRDVRLCVSALKESKTTKFYFEDNIKDDRFERFYQLKFKNEIDGINYRCMADLIIINYENKEIIPCDLKTSSHFEWDFPISFLQWRYDIQAHLYTELIRRTIEKDDYFSDFRIRPYRFIVVNRQSMTPLIWEYNLFGKNSFIFTEKTRDYYDYYLRGPFDIGKELTEYMNGLNKVPKGIHYNNGNEDDLNVLNWYIQDLMQKRRYAIKL